MGKYYKGKYKVKNVDKYAGNVEDVVYRSSWERAAFKWLDTNPDVVEWAAEEVVIPYVCATDRKPHRYFIDLYFKTSKGKKYLVEIKPDSQTKPPKVPTRKTKRYLSEQLTYAKNMSKWTAAQEFAKDNGVEFVIWTENTLKALGMKIL